MFCFHKRSYRELVTDSNVNTDASGKVPKISVSFSQFKTLWQFLGTVPRAPSCTQCTENYAGCNWSLSMIYDFCVICDLQLEKTTGKICWLNSRPPTNQRLHALTCTYLPALQVSCLVHASWSSQATAGRSDQKLLARAVGSYRSHHWHWFDGFNVWWP